MAEAIFRVQRQAGELTRQVELARGNVRGLAGELRELDPQLARAVETLASYRRRLQEGQRLTQAELQHAHEMERVLTTRARFRPGAEQQRREAEAVVQGFRRDLELTRHPPGGGPRPLTPEERREYLARGYTPEELERSVLLKPGTLLIRPRRLEVPAPGEAEQAPAAPLQERARRAAVPGPAGTTAAALAAASRQARDEPRRIDEARDAYLRLQAAKRAQRLEDNQLQAEWRDTNRMLREQQQEVRRLEERMARYRELQRAGFLSRRERLEFERLPARLRDAREGLRQFEREQAALAAEAERRGMQVAGARLVQGGGLMRGQGLMAAAMLAGGMGGGMGTIAAALLRYSPWIAGAYLLTQGIGYARQSYSTYTGVLRELEPAARAAGIAPETIINRNLYLAERYRGVFQPGDVHAATASLLRGVGSLEQIRHLTPVATVTGQTLQETAQQYLALQRLTTRPGRNILGSLLSTFLRSPAAVPSPGTPEYETEYQRFLERGQTRADAPVQPLFDDTGRLLPEVERVMRHGTGRPPLEANVSLFRQFVQATALTAGRLATPYTRIPVEGVAAQISAMMRVGIPGVQPGTPGAIDVAAATVGGINQFFAQPRGDALGDAMMLGVLRLRRSLTEQQRRQLADLGINLNTIPGLIRAMRRAPELQQRGIPVEGAMLGALRQFFPDEEVRQLALIRAGLDPELAFQLSRPELRQVLAARPAAIRDFSGLAVSTLFGPSQDALAVIFERTVRGELNAQRLGSAIADGIGPAVDRMANDFRELLTDFFSRALAQLGEAPG